MTQPKTSKAATLRQLSRILLVAIMLLLGGWSLARADNCTIFWLDMGCDPPDIFVPSPSVFNLPGYGNVEITYSNGDMDPGLGRDRKCIRLAAAQNGTKSYGGDTYSWTTFDALYRLNNGVGNSTPVMYTVTYTFLNGPVPAGELVLGVNGLGRTDSLYGPNFISKIWVNKYGTFLGDYDLVQTPPCGPTEFLHPTAGSFVLRNSLYGNGVWGDPSFNTDLGLVRIDDAVSVLGLGVTHIGQDGFDFTVGRIECPPTGDWMIKEFKNLGPHGAVGVTVVLEGDVTPDIKTFDGLRPPILGYGYFDPPSFTFDNGGNTLIHWSNFTDANNDHCINPGQTVCLGWCLKWPLQSKVLGFYFTANKIPNWVANIEQVNTLGVTYREFWARLVWHNEYMIRGMPDSTLIPDSTLTLKDVKFAAFSTPVSPDSLNQWNIALENALQPMSSDTAPIPLPYDQDVTLPFPTPIPSDQWVVVRYRVESPNSAAEVTDYVMLRPRTGGDIPTLTEWGLIIFGVVLLGFITWVFLKRKKVVGVRL